MKGFLLYLITFTISYFIMYRFYKKIKIDKLVENKRNSALIFLLILFIISIVCVSMSDSFNFGVKYHHVLMGIIMAPTIAFMPFIVSNNKSKH